MGGKTSTSTSTQTIPKEVMKRYSRVNSMAEKAAKQKFRPYKGDFVADVNEQQLAGIDTINNSVNKADPYFQQSQDYLQRGSGTAEAGELDIAKYYNPYQSEVIDSTSRLIDQGNEQQMSGSLGDLIKSGGFGGDRAGISAAVLAGQQQSQRAATLSGLKQQGYQQAVGTAQQQQGVDLAARQADLARLLQASGQSMQTGVAAQQAGLAGGEAQINAGTLQQQTQQAENTAKYQQFLQKRGYPFQVAQFLANIAMGTGSLSGSTTTTEQPAPFFSDRRLKTDIRRIGRSTDGKLPIYSYKYKGDDETHIGFMADEVEKVKPDAVGQSHGYKTVDYDRATRAEGGAVYGQSIGDAPFDGGYVPDGYLKVGQLEPVRPVSGPPQSAMSGLKELWDTGQQITGMGQQVAGWFDTPSKADGGVVGASYLASPPEIVENPSGPLAEIVAEGDDAGTPKLEPTPTVGGTPQSGASGVGSLLSGIASIFALSDPRVKKDAKKIGSTDDGMPIYKFKYKGQDHTHIGFMADDVEERKPEAVARGVDGLRYVDYERASRAEGGVIPVPTLYRPDPPPEVDLAPLREAIASKESPNYYTIHGGEKFHSYDDHPRVNVPLKDGDTSSAAGRYQMIAPTWDNAAKKLGLTNFSPKNQDRAADYVARTDYERRTGSDLGSDVAAGKLGDVRRGLTKTWRGLENLTDEDFAKFFEPQKTEYLAPREDRADGGVVRSLGIVPEERQYEPTGIVRSLGILPRREEPEFISEDADKPSGVAPVSLDYKETPRRYSPPGMKVSELDGQTLVRDPVKPLETRTLGVAPKVVVADTKDEKPLVSVDRYAKVVNAGKGWTEVLDPEGKIVRREGARNWRNNNPGNIEYGDFAKKLGAIGTDGRFAVFPTYEDGRKAKETLLFESPGYKDKSIRNAIYRYAPPSENNSDAYVSAVARSIGVDPDTPLSALGPEQRSTMMDAMQRVEGFKPGRTVVDGVRMAANDVATGVKDIATGVKDVAVGAKDVAGDVVSGVKNVATGAKDAVADGVTNVKDLISGNKSNTDLILSILSGLGTMASSDSRYLGSAMLQGLGGGAKTYAELRNQSPERASKEIENTKALTNAWQQYVALNPSDKDISVQDFAQKFGYEKFLPANKPIDIVEGVDSGIKLEGSPEGDKTPPRAYTLQEFTDLKITKPDGTVIPAANDPGYLNEFIAANASKAPYSEAVASAVNTAKEKLGSTMDVTYDASGTSVPTPGSLDTKSDLAKAETNRETRAEFVKSLPARVKSNDEAITNLNHMEEAFRGFNPGAATSQLSGWASLMKRLDPNGVTPVSKVLAEAEINPAKIEEAKKLASVYLADQMKGMPEGAPASMIEFLNNITPGVEMQPEAIRAIIVRSKADLLSQKAMIDAYYANGAPDDVIKFQTDFVKNNPREKFMKAAEEMTSPLGVAEETTATEVTKIGPNGEGYDKIKPGEQYISPDGQTRVKGGQ